ncbi:MAG: VWA domain-containing protein, partial [Planctomycetes bacterium]|nr:VWA domain-containing protein [Planctomycetota bacterium]
MNETVLDWLHKLLSADAPEHAVLKSVRFDLRGLFPWWVAVLIVVAAGAGTFFLYRREHGRLGLFRRGLMALLRTAAIGLLAFLLLRPTVVAEYLGQRPRGVDLLIDNSQSMTLRDRRVTPPDRMRVAIALNLVPPQTSLAEAVSLGSVPPATPTNPERAQLVRDVLANPRLHLAEDLRKPGTLRVFLFGQNVRGLNTDPSGEKTGDGLENLPVVFKADESRTALGDAVNNLLLRKEGDLPSAIVVMTDGRDNASKLPLDEAARQCARAGVPLFIYGVGSPVGGLLQVKDLAVTDTLFYGDTVAVPVRWRAQGIRQGRVAVALTLGGKEVARREVPVRDGENTEVLTFVPRKGASAEEKLNLGATVKLLDDPTFQDGLQRPVRLVDRRVKVLYIENAPRWEYKFLQTALLRDRRVEASFMLARGDTGVLHSGKPFLPTFPRRDQLFGYDLVILGDVPADYLGKQHQEWLRDFVKEGGGLVVIAGREHAPADYADTP